ncbi:hypothetical protein SAMN04488053_102288 [Alkalicoccus daliensis]|uniref:Uncharacterized protein n=2 Tax=Alkalicoccus daliensis TaxID=745820 RepID=A0A1H0CZM0_9BACI|nr:hypothetical protein SAMN04488053_102288 [Alkalicoccus daliensis]
MIFAALHFVSGCASNEDTVESEELIIKDEWKAAYDGQPLNIGVIGEKPSKTFDNITFHTAEPESLKQEEFDTYFITEEYFADLSEEDWKPVFLNINTPVFFMNIDVQAFIYRVEEMHYEEASPKATEHSQGFVRIEDNIRSWGYGDPMESTDVNETPDWIFNSIFRDVEEHLQQGNSNN